jgi:UDP-3-O-[3-hydroxymyristoyl] glucosamine N-acyltransferase
LPRTLSDIAALLGGEIEGDAQTPVTGAAGVDDAGPGDIVFAEQPRFADEAAASPAAAVIAPPGLAVPGKPLLRVTHPRMAFARVLALFQSPERFPQGIADTARIGAGTTLGEGVAIGDFCRIGDGVTIGDGAVIFPLVFIGDNVTIGPGTVIFPNVTIYSDTEIGARVRIHAGTVIGADGFGYVTVDGQHEKIPHMGRVVIEDDVEIGACSCIDRAKTAETRIGQGTKIDNLVQVAHNVHLGKHCLVAGQTGLAGSSTLGDYVVLGGQVGINSHAHLGSGTRVAAQAGVMSDLPENATVSGYPAQEHNQTLRMWAASHRLPEMLRTVRALERRVQELERALSEKEGSG